MTGRVDLYIRHLEAGTLDDYYRDHMNYYCYLIENRLDDYYRSKMTGSKTRRKLRRPTSRTRFIRVRLPDGRKRLIMVRNDDTIFYADVGKGNMAVEEGVFRQHPAIHIPRMNKTPWSVPLSLFNPGRNGLGVE